MQSATFVCSACQISEAPEVPLLRGMGNKLGPDSSGEVRGLRPAALKPDEHALQGEEASLTGLAGEINQMRGVFGAPPESIAAEQRRGSGRSRKPQRR